MASEGPEAVSVRLGGLLGQSQAQLDGFKSRALRAEAPTQRHLYTTEWRQIEVTGGADAKVLVIGDDESVACERLSSQVSLEELVAKLCNGAWATIAAAVATQRGCLAAAPLFALEVALSLVQMQATTTPARSRYWKVWKRCVSALVCTSGTPMTALAYITWSLRW